MGVNGGTPGSTLTTSHWLLGSSQVPEAFRTDFDFIPPDMKQALRPGRQVSGVMLKMTIHDLGRFEAFWSLKQIISYRTYFLKLTYITCYMMFYMLYYAILV